MKRLAILNIFLLLIYISGCGDEKSNSPPLRTQKPYGELVGNTSCKSFADESDSRSRITNINNESRSQGTALSGKRSNLSGKRSNLSGKRSKGTTEVQGEDCMEYDYKNHTLTLKHINAAFNCCPQEIFADISLRADTILIVESEAESLCECLCLFDLDMALYELPAGKYTILVKEPYLEKGDEPLSLSVDLEEEPSGKHCVKRSRYPWL